MLENSAQLNIKEKVNKFKKTKATLWVWLILVIFLLWVVASLANALASVKEGVDDLKSEVQEQTKKTEGLDRELNNLRNDYSGWKVEQEKKQANGKVVSEPPRPKPAERSRPYVAKNEIEAYIQEVFGDYAGIARAVCMAESGLRPDAISKTSDWGVCQIHTFNGKRGPYTALQLLDYKINIQMAWEISSHGTNWNPWVTFTNGNYLKFL